jgi:tripartite-type tricarboxylate transporter receptor subunit TctC
MPNSLPNFRGVLFQAGARRLLRAFATAGLAALLATGSLSAHADIYPSQTIKLVVGFPPGGGGDTYARIIAAALQRSLGQAVIVENKPGAGGNIAAEVVAHAKPDGYTLLLAMSGNFAIAPVVQPHLNYQVPGSFVPISMLVETPFGLMVSSTSKYDSIKRYIDAARDGRLSCASTGMGTAAQTTMDLFKKRAGLKILSVPYNGSGPAITALLGGQVDSFFAPYTPLAGQITGGSMRLIATTAAQRSAAFPNVPTFKELGLDVSMTQWYGLAAPAGTPTEAVSVLAKNVAIALKQPDVLKFYSADGAVPGALSGAAFSRFIVQDIERYRQAIGTPGAASSPN